MSPEQTQNVADDRVDRYLNGEPAAEILNLPEGVCDLLYHRAYHLLAAGLTARAEKLFCGLCVLDPKRARHFLGYGLCLMRRGSLRFAAAQFHLAIRTEPDWAAPYFHLCGAYLAEGRKAEAGAALARFLSVANDQTPGGQLESAKQLKESLVKDASAMSVQALTGMEKA